MNTKLGLFALPALFFAGAVQAAALTVDFENGAQSFFTQTGYDFFFVDGVNPQYGGGFGSVATASPGTWVASNWQGNPSVNFTALTGEAFSLDSFLIAGAWGSQTFTVTGYGSDGALKYSTDINTTMNATTQNFGWTDITSFSITYVDGTFVPGNLPNQRASQWVLDDVRVTTVPEPETYAMMLAGLGVMGAVVRIRRRKQA